MKILSFLFLFMISISVMAQTPELTFKVQIGTGDDIGMVFTDLMPQPIFEVSIRPIIETHSYFGLYGVQHWVFPVYKTQRYDFKFDVKEDSQVKRYKIKIIALFEDKIIQEVVSEPVYCFSQRALDSIIHILY